MTDTELQKAIVQGIREALAEGKQDRLAGEILLSAGILCTWANINRAQYLRVAYQTLRDLSYTAAAYRLKREYQTAVMEDD